MSRPPAPEPLPHPVVDNHTHLDHARRGEDQVDVAGALAAAAAVGVTRMVQIGCDVEAARWTVDLVDREPALLGGVALHPTEATRLAAAGELDTALAEIEQLAAHPRVRVVGETGLDHYWVTDEPGRAAQEESFRRHVDLAKRLGKVLQIHDRDAHDDVLRVLTHEGAPERTVFHCFSGDAELAQICAENGWYMSFAGTVTFKNADGLREALSLAPRNLLLIETDAPFLTPAPFRGRPNAPYLLPHTLRSMADQLDTDVSVLAAQISSNTELVYGRWDAEAVTSNDAPLQPGDEPDAEMA